jgi:hypothetical protein
MKNRVESSNDKNKDAVMYRSGGLNTQYAGMDLSNQQQEYYGAGSPF